MSTVPVLSDSTDRGRVKQVIDKHTVPNVYLMQDSRPTFSTPLVLTAKGFTRSDYSILYLLLALSFTGTVV